MARVTDEVFPGEISETVLHKSTTGPVGDAVAANVTRIREACRATYVDLSKRLTDLGHPIAVLGLRRIERGERRVDTDDLLALAVALGVHPVDLLVPPDLADDAPYKVAPLRVATADDVRAWIGGMPPGIETRLISEARRRIGRQWLATTYGLPEFRRQSRGDEWWPDRR